MEPSRRISDLYCRYNGALMGAFMADAHCRSEMPAYAAVRQRIEIVLDELAIDLALPESHAEYKLQYPGLAASVQARLSRVSVEMESYYRLGSMVTVLLVATLLGQSAAALEGPIAELFEENGLSHEWLSDMIARVRSRGDRTFSGAAPVLSGAFAFAAHAVRELAPEADTAFVAMPFKEPYESHFRALYRPLLESIGCRVVRAWGGVDIEAYQALLHVLIGKSGVMLADVTGCNANVIHEFGVFSGAEDRTRFGYLLVDKTFDTALLPSNLGDRRLLSYDTGAPGWPPSEVRRLNRFLQDAEPMVAMRRARRDREKRPLSGHAE